MTVWCRASTSLVPKMKTWMAGHRRAAATPFFERLCPAMTTFDSARVENALVHHAAVDERRRRNVSALKII
jgi:hypothetical protein